LSRQPGNTNEFGQPQSGDTTPCPTIPNKDSKTTSQAAVWCYETGAGCHRSVMMTNCTFVDMPCLKQSTFLMATAWTAKSFRPPEFDDGLKTTFFIGKVLLPVPKTRDRCLHDRSSRWESNVLFFTASVAEAEVDKFNVVFLN